MCLYCTRIRKQGVKYSQARRQICTCIPHAFVSMIRSFFSLFLDVSSAELEKTTQREGAATRRFLVSYLYKFDACSLSLTVFVPLLCLVPTDSMCLSSASSPAFMFCALTTMAYYFSTLAQNDGQILVVEGNSMRRIQCMSRFSRSISMYLKRR